jgi:putative cell wall-binding protein
MTFHRAPSWAAIGIVALSAIALAGGLQTPVAASAMQTPVAADDFFSVGPGAKLAVAGPGLLSNDTHSAGAEEVTFQGSAGPYHGTLAAEPGTANGGFTYRSEPGFSGYDAFSYCVISATPSPCWSNRATVVIKVGEPTVTRVAGADRYEGAVRISQRTNTSGSSIVFVASGQSFPDALGAVPVAASRAASLILTEAERLPPGTREEIRRLRPDAVAVVGGARTVSDRVLEEIRSIVAPGAQVVRISGADRFAVSRTLATDWMGAATHAFVSSGLNFPDALAAGAVAGARKQPVLLLDGGASTVDSATQATLLTRATSTITIVGGPASVSSGVESTLGGIAVVGRVSGADRYEVAVNLSKASVAGSRVVYLVTGQNYPDALVGGVWAAQDNAPMYLAPGDCVPTAVLADIARIGASEVRLLGGTNSLSERVARLEHC